MREFFRVFNLRYEEADHWMVGTHAGGVHWVVVYRASSQQDAERYLGELPPHARESQRFPFRPLMDLAGNGSVHDFAEATGRTSRVVYRWQREGVPARSADALCVQLGLHPAEVWPEWCET